MECTCFPPANVMVGAVQNALDGLMPVGSPEELAFLKEEFQPDNRAGTNSKHRQLPEQNINFEAQMFRALLMTAFASILSMSSAAHADQQGHRPIHVATGLELGARLSAKIAAEAPQADKIKSDFADQGAAGEAATAKQAPARKVRVVYPVPYAP